MLSKADLWKKWIFNNTPHSSEATYARIIQMIKANANFSFLRMGDGDIKAYLNIPQTTILSEQYRAIYEVALNPIFKYKEETQDPRLIVGIENSTVCINSIYKENRKNGIILDNFYQRFKHTDALSINSILFMHMYVYYGLNDFFESLRNRSVILVGPNHLKNLDFPCVEKHHIITELTHSWEKQDKYEEALTLLLKQVKNPVIIYASSVTGKMLLSKMFFQYSDITQIDVGAALDPYAGAMSRPWHKNELRVNQDTSVSLLLHQSDLNRSLEIDPFLHFFNKNVSLNVPKYYSNQDFSNKLKDWKFLKTSSNSWLDKLIFALSQITTTYVVYIQEDFWAKDPFNMDMLTDTLSQLNSNSLDCIYVCKANYSAAKLSKIGVLSGSQLNGFEKNSNYIFNYQFAIWNTQALLRILREITGKNRVSCEFNGTSNIIKRSEQRKYQIVDYPWYIVASPDKKTPEMIELLKNTTLL
jgi:hypothetical protein